MAAACMAPPPATPTAPPVTPQPTPPPSQAPEQRSYVVQPGDTLHAIAVQFGTTVDARSMTVLGMPSGPSNCS